jgi:hypothetical protein
MMAGPHKKMPHTEKAAIAVSFVGKTVRAVRQRCAEEPIDADQREHHPI